MLPQDLLIANFTTSAGVATKSDRAKAVLPMNFKLGRLQRHRYDRSIMTVATSGPYDIFGTPHKFHSPYTQNFNLKRAAKAGRQLVGRNRLCRQQGTKLVRLTDANEPDATDTRPNPNFNAIDLLTPISSSLTAHCRRP